MSDSDAKSRFQILHLEISHGSDRYDIHLHMERALLVRDLMAEIENKSRVPMVEQQLLYRGQRLHQTPDKPLKSFGLFNGNRIVLVGEKLDGLEDEHFRRLLDIEKHVKLIDDVLELVCRDFEKVKESRQARHRCEKTLYDIQTRGERCQADLKTFQSLVDQLKVEQAEPDAWRKKQQVVAFIRDRLDISSNVISAVSSYQGDNSISPPYNQ